MHLITIFFIQMQKTKKQKDIKLTVMYLLAGTNYYLNNILKHIDLCNHLVNT